MTTPSECGSLAAALSEVARLGLAQVDFDVVQTAALAVWHGRDVVSLMGIQGPHMSDAASLVERLCCYNIVSENRKREVMEQVRLVREAFGIPRDESFETAFRVFLPRLQPLQTRHFSAHD